MNIQSIKNSKIATQAIAVSAAITLLLSAFPVAFLQAEESSHVRLGFHKVCLLEDGGMRLTFSNYNPEAYEVEYTVVGTGETGVFTVAAATETEGKLKSKDYKKKTTVITTETETDEGRVDITYYNGTKEDTIIRRAQGQMCEPLPSVATLEIIKPGIEGKKLDPAPHTFKAEYIDNDAVVDAIQWAIRKGTCAANTNTVAGNVDGKNNPSTFSGNTFKAVVDMTGWAAGDYCFIVNPNEQGGPDLRATRMFTVKSTPEVSI
jgi:hypothetical protein